MGRQNAGEDSGSQTTQGEEEGKFTMSQQSGKSVEERILLEKRKKDQSSCDSGAGLRGEVRPARTGVYLWADLRSYGGAEATKKSLRGFTYTHRKDGRKGERQRGGERGKGGREGEGMLSWEEGMANIPLLGQGRLEVWEWMYRTQEL